MGVGFLALALFGASPPAAAQGSEDLAKRVQQLEQQIVDMQVTIGTLESLAGGGRAQTAPSSSGYGGDSGGFYGSSGGGADSARLDSIETQIRALTAQIEQLSRQGGGGQRGSLDRNGSSYGAVRSDPYNTARAQPPPRETAGFGSTTVQSADSSRGDPIGGFLSDGGDSTSSVNGWSVSPRGQEAGRGQEVARAPIGGGQPREAYEAAYGYLLQQDYVSAETAFSDFVNQYPQDQLASNAQYWLGETHYVRGDYKSAASAFLKGYEDYRTGPKASDSLLKLSMSLQRLGQKDAACSSFAELTARFPQASQDVKQTAQQEQARAGC